MVVSQIGTLPAAGDRSFWSRSSTFAAGRRRAPCDAEGRFCAATSRSLSEKTPADVENWTRIAATPCLSPAVALFAGNVARSSQAAVILGEKVNSSVRRRCTAGRSQPKE
jgi:hypothetical protein